MNTVHIEFTSTAIYETIPIKQVDVGHETFTLNLSRRNLEGDYTPRIMLEPSAIDDGCEVEEVPSDYAAKLLYKLFGVYVYE